MNTKITCSLSFQPGFVQEHQGAIREIRKAIQCFFYDEVRPYIGPSYTGPDITIGDDLPARGNKLLMVSVELPPIDEEMGSLTNRLVSRLRDDLIAAHPVLMGHIDINIGPAQVAVA